MLHIEEEQEPGGQGEDVLYHGPEGNVQHAFQYLRAEFRNTVQSKLTAVKNISETSSASDEPMAAPAMPSAGKPNLPKISI